MKTINFVFMVVLLILSGCSSSNNEAPNDGGEQTQVHPSDWISLHGAEANADLRSCQGCHGFDFKGGGDAVSCFNCHSSGPPFVGAHPESWNSDPLKSHQLNFQGTLSDKTPWTDCANAACHGADLQGSSGPSCMDDTASCHATSTNDGWPNAPHPSYASPTVHGPAAKGETDPSLSMGNYCLLCHGIQPNTFDGGFVTLYYGGKGNCSACHADATAHPTNWVSTRTDNNVYHNDGSLTDGIQSDSCALCHTTTGATPASPFPGAPTCFNSTFNGLNCHASGPGSAPHAIPYLDPSLHGPAAKADLVYCQGCHADTGTALNFGVAGSNPRFDVPKPGMPSGCETCHPVGAAHPTGTDRWTFNYDSVDATRRTHFASGNVATACVLCHDVNGTNNGGTAPLCTSCHATTSPFTLNCNACHETPPVTGTPNLTGATLVNHAVGTDVTLISNHEDCSICHGASENGTTGILAAKPTTTSYTIFSGTGQGGNHLDGLIEVNTDVGYQDASVPAAEQFGCNLACHPNDTKHQLPNSSGLTTNYGAYTAGTVSCTDCHGYPPNGTIVAPGATAGVDHSNIPLEIHGECQTCHGTKESSPGSGVLVKTSTYDPAVNHYNGNINMNSETGYNYATFGCSNTGGCHLDDPQHQLSDSGLGEETGAYGAGSCDFCHGYPPDGTSDTIGAPAGTTRVDHTAFTDGGALLLSEHLECQTCHGVKETSPNSGTLDPSGDYVTANHRDGKIQMNLDADYQDVNAPVPSEQFGCNAACHVNGSPYVLPNGSNLPVQLLSLGISGACDSCHGNPPIDSTSGGPTGLDNSVVTGSATAGKHNLHANTNGYDCDTCHTGTANSGQMPNNGMINIGFNIVLGTTTDTTGSYDGRSTGGGYTAAAGTSVSAGDGLTCAAIYCHGTATPQWADAGTAVCGSCHGDTSGMPSTTSGDGDLSGATSGKKVGKHASHVVTQVFACSVCHNGAGDGTTKHVDGTNDIAFDSTLAGGTAAYNAGSSTCSSLSCHGDAVWDTASTGGCDFCHGYPPNSTNNNHVSGFTPVNHTTNSFAPHDECSYCHGVKRVSAANQTQIAMATTVLGGSYTYKTSGAGMDHIDTSITMNGLTPTGAGYDPSTGGCDTGVCHANDGLHQFNVGAVGTGNTLQGRDFGPGLCNSCHFGGNTVGAPEVVSTSTHVITTVGGIFNDCTDCHSGHTLAAGGVAGGVDIPLPPTSWDNPGTPAVETTNMRTQLGLDYNSHGGIRLGGPGTVASINTKTSEAEICWGCHDVAGDNASPATANIGELMGLRGGGQYTFGRLADAQTGGAHISNWTNTSAWRQDDFDNRLTRPIASVHSVNLGTQQGSEVRRSSSVADNVTGGKIHRSSTTINNALPGNAKGQGSTNAVVLEDVQYIRCSYCHDVHSLNKSVGGGDSGQQAPFLRGSWLSDPYPADVPPTASQVWTDNNSHAFGSKQAGKGGMPRNEANATGQGGYFIDQNSGNPSDGETVSSAAGLCTLCHGSTVNGMDYYTGSKLWVGTNGHNNSTISGTGTNATDLFDARRKRTNFYMALQDRIGDDIKNDIPPWGETDAKKDRADNSNWYGTYNKWYAASSVGDRKNGTDIKAHNFTCSKCHSPHATGLPALLITNCLDTELGGWANPNSTSGRVKYDQPQSNNCHRKTTSNAADLQNNGWNTLAPKQ